jgi:uncharacterized membrane protein
VIIVLIENFLLFITGVSTSLIAGLMFGYSVSVNLGLGRLTDFEYLRAMQNINRAILNPIFFITFVGSLILLFLTAILHINDPSTQKFSYLVLAFIFYGIHFVITGTRNVPLNNRLEELNLNDLSKEEYSDIRSWYEKSWNRWHTIRTIASIISVTLIFLSLI